MERLSDLSDQLRPKATGMPIAPPNPVIIPFLDHVIKLKGTYLVLQHPQSGQVIIAV